MTIELQLYSILIITALFFSYKAVSCRRKTWAFVNLKNIEMTRKYNNKFFIYTIIGLCSWALTFLATSSL